MFRHSSLLLASAALGALVSGAAQAQNSSQQNPSFNLVNRTRQVIERVYATPAGMTNWGSDRLGDDLVNPGQRYAVRLPADGNCIYDIRVEYKGGGSDEQRGLNTCTVTDVTFPNQRAGTTGRQGSTQGSGRQAARDPSFRVINQGRVEVNSVYASPTGNDDWGSDRLGDNTIPPGRNQVIRLPPGQCIYDVRVVFTDKAAIERREVNLCEVTDFPVR